MSAGPAGHGEAVRPARRRRSPRSPTSCPTGGCASTATAPQRTELPPPGPASRALRPGRAARQHHRHGAASGRRPASPRSPRAPRASRSSCRRRWPPASRSSASTARPGRARSSSTRSTACWSPPDSVRRHGDRPAPAGLRRGAAPKLGAGALQLSNGSTTPTSLAEQWVGDLRGRAQRAGSSADGGCSGRLAVDSTTARPGEQPDRGAGRDHAGHGPERSPSLARSASPAASRDEWFVVPPHELDDADGRRADGRAGRVPPRLAEARPPGVPLAPRPRLAPAGRSAGDGRRSSPATSAAAVRGREPRALAPGRREAEPARPRAAGSTSSSGRGRRRRAGRPDDQPLRPPSPPAPRPSTPRSRASPSARCR